METKILCAGFGGQGVMSLGQLIAYAGMLEKKQVSWMPSYGPEMRGGTANCAVIVSDKEIGAPLVFDDADIAIIMNLPSLVKFEQDLKPGGSLFINSSIIEQKATREDIKAYYIDASNIAGSVGNNRTANIVMLGALLAVNKIVQPDLVFEAFKKVFGPSKERFIPLNKEAFKAGAQVVAS